jgi:hypothetical protein
MASRTVKKQDEFPFFYEDDAIGVTVTLPAQDDEPSDSPDAAMFSIADEAIHAAEEQLRLDRASGWNEPRQESGEDATSIPWFLRGAKLCVECFTTYPLEAQVRCCACGGSVCPECSVELEELDTVLCPACLRSCASAEEA